MLFEFLIDFFSNLSHGKTFHELIWGAWESLAWKSLANAVQKIKKQINMQIVLLSNPSNLYELLLV